MSIAVDVEQLRPVLHALGVGDPSAVTSMEGGSSPVFRVDLADGERLVLKTYPDDRPWAPGKDKYAAGLLSELDIPVTRYLMLDESKSHLPFRFAITTYLPGVTADSLKNEPDIADIYRQMGALLKQLHSVKMPGYGHVGAKGVIKPLATNTEFVRTVAEDTFRRFREYGGDADLTRRLEKIFEERFELVAHSSGAVFAHDDVHPGNVLVARDAQGRLRLTGLIDFGNARAADSVYDLAKSIFCSEHQAPGCSDTMREGYGAIDHPDPEGALWLYTLLHRAMMWWWLRHIGDVTADEPHGLIDSLHEMARDPLQ
jgi:aminoglycoside phosphotransferase (APT) family kinase protein